MKESRSCKLATDSGRAFHWIMASGKKSTYNNSCLFGSDEMSLSDSNGTFYVWAGRSLGEVLPQFHGPSYKRDKGGHPPDLQLG